MININIQQNSISDEGISDIELLFLLTILFLLLNALEIINFLIFYFLRLSEIYIVIRSSKF